MNTTPFRPADHLHTMEEVLAFIIDALEDDDVLHALAIARTALARLAEGAGVDKPAA